MNPRTTHSVRSSELPITLRPLFWDYNFVTLSWENDRDLIMARVLALGDWVAVTWLRSCVEEHALRAWIEHHYGGGMSPRRLRFWEVILGLPHRQVNAWLAAAERQVWDKRVPLSFHPETRGPVQKRVSGGLGKSSRSGSRR